MERGVSSTSIHARAGTWRVGWRTVSSASNTALDVAIVVDETLSSSTASSVVKEITEFAELRRRAVSKASPTKLTTAAHEGTLENDGAPDAIDPTRLPGELAVMSPGIA
eukprot:349388-Pleurochrysis_carterae.AAC.1